MPKYVELKEFSIFSKIGQLLCILKSIRNKEKGA
jgi:hypothetical protein